MVFNFSFSFHCFLGVPGVAIVRDDGGAYFGWQVALRRWGAIAPQLPQASLHMLWGFKPPRATHTASGVKAFPVNRGRFAEVRRSVERGPRQTPLHLS